MEVCHLDAGYVGKAGLRCSMQQLDMGLYGYNASRLNDDDGWIFLNTECRGHDQSNTPAISIHVLLVILRLG